jgi:hypothetical protein
MHLLLWNFDFGGQPSEYWRWRIEACYCLILRQGEGSCQFCIGQDILKRRQLVWDGNDSMSDMSQNGESGAVVMKVAYEVVEFRWMHRQ